MIKQKIPVFFAQYLETDLEQAGPEGLLIAGMAQLLNPEKVIAPMAKDVENFHRKYEIQYMGNPRMLTESMRAFRLARAKEEVAEYEEAKTKEKALDALIDEIYIAFGTLHLHGFSPAAIQEAWKRVHEANMAKELCSPENPGKHGHHSDIVKPKDWVAPTFEDLCKTRLV